MWQCDKMFHKPTHSQKGLNPELRTLFYKLAWLLQAYVVPVFVFDGPDRPTVKRGHHVRKKAHSMTTMFRCLIAAFGFHSHNVSTLFVNR